MNFFDRRSKVNVKMSRFLVILSLLCVCIYASGCSSIIARIMVSPSSRYLTSSTAGLYVGVNVDIRLTTSFFEDYNTKAYEAAYGLIDMPFSFVIDTVLIPYDLYMYKKLKEKQGRMSMEYYISEKREDEEEQINIPEEEQKTYIIE